MANNGPFPRIILLCPVEAHNVRDGALRCQNRVLIWIDGHLPPRVIEFFLTDWIQENALSHAQDDLGAGREVEITQLFWKTELEVKGNARGRGLPEVVLLQGSVVEGGGLPTKGRLRSSVQLHQRASVRYVACLIHV